MTRRRSCSAPAALAALLIAPAPAAAHPHMFVDARSELVADAEGRLSGVRTRLLIDELTSLFVLEENGVAATDAPLTEPQRAAIAAGMVDGLGHYDFFTDLKIDGARIAFSAAAASDVRIEGDRLAATLELTLPSPQALRGRAIELALYDPTYFAAVDTLDAPSLPQTLGACRAELVEFEPTNLDAVTLAALGALSREETPEEPRIGARFADRSAIACAD